MSQAPSPSTGTALWPGACLPCVGHRALHRLLAAARALDAWHPTGALGPCTDDDLVALSVVSCRQRPSPAKATARCGHGCGIAVSAPRRAGSCA